MMRIGVVALLLAGAAVAQEEAPIPNGPWSLGVGVFGGSAIGGEVPGKLDIALSVAGTYEQEFWFVGLEGMAAQVGQRSPQSLIGVLRGGFVAPWKIAPFIAFGMAGMNQKLRSDAFNTDGSGFAVTAELGVMLFRDRRIGRGTISLMGVQPAFKMALARLSSDAFAEPRAPLVLAGARLLY